MGEQKTEPRSDFMSDDQVKRIDEFLLKIEQNRGYMGDRYAEIEKIQLAYSNNQVVIPNRPNSRVNIINANVEGQVSGIVEQNLAVSTRGEGPSDEPFAHWGRIGLDWTFRQNYMRSKILKPHERRRSLFGWAWLKVYFDSKAIKGFGLAKYTCPPLQNMFIDNKINDFTRIQEAEYIAEVIEQSKEWAEQQDRYKDRAKNIHYGGTDKATIFKKERTSDDENAFWLVQLWTKTDGMLRLEEFSDDGVLLYDSFEEKKEPYYRYNQYPYFLTIMYPEEGELLGFGDGRLLRPLQDMINDLYDQIRRAARPNRLFFDEASEVDLESIDEDDGPIPCVDPNTNIRVVEVGRVNPALWNLLDRIHQEAQRVTRFSDLMIGQNKSSDTATEAAIQQQQGSASIDAKKIDLQDTLVEASKYALDLMMEHYTEGKAFRIDENKDDYEWIDFRQLNEVPVTKPASDGFIKQFKENNPDKQTPKWELLTDGGKPVTKSVDFDIEISIGAGLPKNKAFLWQMLERLAGLVLKDETGNPKNVVSYNELRLFLKDFLGIPLEDTKAMPQPMNQPMNPANPPQPLMSANAQGLSMNGAPMQQQRVV